MTAAALVVAGLGCGSGETSDSPEKTVVEAERAPDHPVPSSTKAFVEYSDGRVTVRCNGALRLAVLEQLAEQAGFEILAGRVDAQPITLDIERVPLIEAIASILDGLSYNLGYDFDAASGARVLARVQIGRAIASSAERRPKTTPSVSPPVPEREPRAAIREAASAGGDQMISISAEDAAERAEALAALSNPDPEVRADAASWIDLDEKTLPQMIAMLESDPDPEVRSVIVDRLGDDESPAAIDALVAALRDPDSEVVLQSIEILETEAEERLLPELEPLLAHPDPEVREAAQDAKDFIE